MRAALAGVLIVASAFVVGSGVAALPYIENDPCLVYLTETGPGVGWERSLIPYGTRCVSEGVTVERLAPSVGTLLAWWGATALLLGVALRLRRHASARGIVLALGVLGGFGLAGHESDFIGAFLVVVVFGAPIWFLAAWRLQPDRRWHAPVVLAGALPFTAACVWFAGSSSGYGQDGIGVLMGLLAGGALAAVVERLPLRSVLSLPASPP